MSNFVDVGGLFVPNGYYDTLTEASGNWRSEFDSPYNRTTWGETLGIFGAFDLREWNFSERIEVIKRARMAWERNPVANTAVSLTTLFVVGKGLNVTYQASEVKEVLEDFINDPDNDFEAAQTEYLDSLQVDGELFVRVVSERGKTVIVPLEPWNIPYVRHEIGMPLRRTGYNYRATINNGHNEFATVDEWIPAEEVIHVAINKSPYEVRGRSDLFRILPWIKAHKDGLEEISRLIRRMSVYYHLKVQGTPAQVNAARGAYKEPPPPASILVTDKNTELNAVSSNLRASDMSTHVRELRMMNALGKRLPEYMLSDGANANLATTQSQQLPALRNFTYFADVMVDRLWKPLLKRVITAAIDAGACPEVVDVVDSEGEAVLGADGEQKQMDAVEAFTCGYRELEADDPNSLAQALQLAVTMGWVSNETAAVKLGYDYAVERKKIEAERAIDAASAYSTGTTSGMVTGRDGEPQGQQTGGMIPAQAGDSTENDGDDATEADEVKAADMALMMREALQGVAAVVGNQKPVQINLPHVVMEATYQPQAVNMPEVTVNVPAPVVNVEVAAPNVTVEAAPAPDVTVQAPPAAAVTVNVPETNIQVNLPEPRPVLRHIEISRDRDGRVTGGTVQEE